MKRKYIILLCLIISLKSFAQGIEKESAQSLYVEMYRDTMPLGSATGFIIKSKTRSYFITNYHVVTNKNPRNDQWLHSSLPISPNRLLILHNGKKLGEHVVKVEPLYNLKGNTLWNQYTINNEIVDVVALPLTDTSGVTIYDVQYKSNLDTMIAIAPTSQVFILGFPLGIRSASEFPIWKTGTIASEPEINQEKKPIIWVDASTFPGMSGSPVYIMGNQLAGRNGGMMMFSNRVSVFLGVFSHAQSQNVYGAMWKASYLRTLFDKLP